MRIYEYATKRNVKSRDVVKKCQELGIHTVKNHLSLLPLKMVDILDGVSFLKKGEKIQRIPLSIGIVVPSSSWHYREKIKVEIRQNYQKGNQIAVFIPGVPEEDAECINKFEINGQKGQVYRKLVDEVTYFYLQHIGPNTLTEIENIAFYTLGTIELMQHLKFDRIDLHDWQLGLFSIIYRQHNSNTKMKHHVYDFSYQGIYDKRIPGALFDLDGVVHKELIEHAGSVNFFKALLTTADEVVYQNESLEMFKASYLKEYVYDH